MKTPFFMIGVVGSRQCSTDVFELAFQVGRNIALKGYVLVCGGLGGVMEGAAKGASSENGLTIGLLPGTRHEDANPYITIPIPTGLDHARNTLIARASHGIIAISGGYGTLSEIALAVKMGKPVVGLQTWPNLKELTYVSTPREAVEALLER